MLVLETERMFLRSMVETDVENLLEILSDPEAMRYYPSTRNREQTLRWIEWTLENYKKFGIGFWVAELKEHNQFVGQCGLLPQEVEGEHETEIAYLFVRKYWGKGIATEAAIACKEYGFNKLGCQRLISLIDKNNNPSKRVAQRVGMQFEKEIIKWDKPVEVYCINKIGY